MIELLKQKFAALPRAVARAGVAAALALCTLPALAQTSVDDAMLTIERPAAFYAQMPGIAAEIGPVLEVADKERIPAVVQQGSQLARTAFDAPRLLTETRATMAKAPDAGALGKDLPAVAARFREHEAVIDAMSADQLHAAAPTYEAKLKARDDTGAIRKLAFLMAAPDLGTETVVTGKRIKWIYESIILGNANKLRTLSDDEVEKGVRQILEYTRKVPLDEQPGPFMRGPTLEGWRLRKQAVLAQMSKEDVAALLAFYSSASGRAKRAAIVDTFVASNDQAARAVIMGLLATRR
jgi:hypothetical protein